MRIEGYEAGPLAAGESMLSRPGFWAHHLLGICGDWGGAERPGPESIGGDGADVDALADTLLDPGWWPVFRVTASNGLGVVVVYRNAVGDYGIDHLFVEPGRDAARRIVAWDADVSGAGLTWQDLLALADDPATTAEGVHDPAARLLLLLPLLAAPAVPDGAPARVGAALAAVGAPEDTAASTAEFLLARLTSRAWHDPAWTSPLSGS
ncbi:hypothetical protein [Streptomyces sp. HNS054]|uniref:hypothetical protein n=1 Tax=Streptomyces sp. HNS054 TaxID=1662446 RepID=UPI0006535416|nr:hypothetical protein [Streptomyces sp. HNS054]WPW23044.1 hypothetical protein UBV09_32120 [Streptomyces griseoincarnatus]